MQRTRFTLLLTCLGLAACSVPPEHAYFKSAGPEQLLNVSSERVDVPLGSASAQEELIGWLNDDTPARAEITCKGSEKACADAEETLKQFGVQYTVYAGDMTQASLIYERVIARECDATIRVNHINPYSLPTPGMGCTVAANSLQMISDRQQIIAPAMLGYQDADKTTLSVINAYRTPSDDALDYDDAFGQK